ncbi:MAG TPA: histidine kinase [Cyanobacteria bacterium UBA11148]|nr:histidine kinase [Cyanobacteria bacterium UBA11148]
MLFSNSRHPPKIANNLAITKRQNSGSYRNPITLLPLPLIKGWIRRLSIAQKIGYGYSLAIGVSILGTIGGLVLGNYYQEQAQHELTIADQQQHLLSDLENTVASVRSHPQQLVGVLGQSSRFDAEMTKFLAAMKSGKSLLLEIEEFIETNPHHLAINSTELKSLLKDYETNVESYNQLVQYLWKQINSDNLKPEEIQNLQQQLLNFMRWKSSTEITVQFEYLSNRLNEAKEFAELQQIAANHKLEHAEELRLQIMVFSIILSVGIAVVLALITRDAIARPLENVTQVAKAIVQESNFNLRTPVTTEDEVGLLATSPNQLVECVGDYTEELKLARQTLEQRVEERTQELTQALRELQQTQAQLVQSEKMSSLGQMVAGIAHEINNPINFIYGNLEYAKSSTQDLLELIRLYRQEYPSPTPVIQDYLEEIDLDFLTQDMPKLLSSLRMGAERIQEIVVSLRKFSRLDEAQMKAVDIHEGLENTLLILNNRLNRQINVIKKYEPLPRINCYPAQLNQVFLNVLTNAIDALEERRNLQQEEIGKFKPTIIIQTHKVGDRSILVKIWNNGREIPVDIQEKLFDPFFTTKPVGKGTGMGLAICYQIVEKHKGKIEVISEFGQGVEFAIILPIEEENGE